VLELNSKKLTVIPSNYIKHNRPTWTYDDSAVISAIYTKEFTDLFELNIESGEAKRLTEDDAHYGVMTSPTTLLYTKDNEEGLWQKELNSDSKPIIKIGSDKFRTLYTWDYLENGIYFRKNEKNHHQLTFYDFATQSLVPVVRLPLRTFENYGALTALPKENKLIFTSAIYPQSDIKRIKHPLIHKD